MSSLVDDELKVLVAGGGKVPRRSDAARLDDAGGALGFDRCFVKGRRDT